MNNLNHVYSFYTSPLNSISVLQLLFYFTSRVQMSPLSDDNNITITIIINFFDVITQRLHHIMTCVLNINFRYEWVWKNVFFYHTNKAISTKSVLCRFTQQSETEIFPTIQWTSIVCCIFYIIYNIIYIMYVYKINASETKSPYTARLTTVLDKTLLQY